MRSHLHSQPLRQIMSFHFLSFAPKANHVLSLSFFASQANIPISLTLFALQANHLYTLSLIDPHSKHVLSLYCFATQANKLLSLSLLSPGASHVLVLLPFAPQANHVLSLSFLASQANHLHFLSSSFFPLSLLLLFFANTDMAYSLRQISLSLFFFCVLYKQIKTQTMQKNIIHAIDKN